MSIIIAVLYSLFLSIRFMPALGIKPRECRAYLQKSVNLTLCYLAFRSRRSFTQAALAGRAAFLCCAYDVVTDWRGFCPQLGHSYRSILEKYAPPRLVRLACSLYAKDRDGCLQQDGLERGPIAFIFVTGLMGSEPLFAQRGDMDRVGLLLQLVDDILDYEQDMAKGDLNCLCSGRREYYLSLASSYLTEDFVSFFFPSRVMSHVIGHARRKAILLESRDPGLMHPDRKLGLASYS